MQSNWRDASIQRRIGTLLRANNNGDKRMACNGAPSLRARCYSLDVDHLVCLLKARMRARISAVFAAVVYLRRHDTTFPSGQLAEASH